MSATVASACEPIALDEVHNVLGPSFGHSPAEPTFPLCADVEVDVSGYVEGGSELNGREPADVLSVRIESGESIVESTVALGPRDRIVRVSPADARPLAGTPIASTAPGQRVTIVIGRNIGAKLRSYCAVSGTLGAR